MRIDRTKHKESSNNADNPNQNVCALAVARVFGAQDEVRYLHTIQDLVRAIRKTSYHVRSRKSGITGKTVGAVRGNLRKKIGAAFYICVVEGHVLCLDRDGKTIVDTDKRQRDRRKIIDFYGVFFDGQVSMFGGEILHIDKHLKKWGLYP